ncbi:glycerophosphodiester phosphodiesterase [Pseudomonas oryzihabitans]|uniref:glycerophosphodiester phosphodiesterase n=1 Tax=Pseudomonas oryzihabitans TaxID=47885 RepID=UPI0011A2FB69|nr:glycerophosphodiester phosphodiesterase [Pseudomonas oryzihabitans]
MTITALRTLIRTLIPGTLLVSQLALATEADVGQTLARQAGIPWPAVIAHRGASFDAPESTAPAYLVARELGADYLELDLQRTKDGQLIALHDDTLERTTDVAKRFPERAKAPVSQFTLAELKSLDAGSWFNQAHPDRARPKFAGLRILTLDEVIDIAEGGRNKPGLYIETKQPKLFPGIERDLKAKLTQRGWLGKPKPGATGVAAMPGRVVLQTFEKGSLELLQKEMPNTPKILLLWLGDDYIPAKPGPTYAESGEASKAAYYAKQQVRSEGDFTAWIEWAKAHGAIGIGPSAALEEGGDQSYADLVKPWMNDVAHERGLLVHAYTVDSAVDYARLAPRGVDGFFSNRAAELLKFYERPAKQAPAALLKQLGY